MHSNNPTCAFVFWSDYSNILSFLFLLPINIQNSLKMPNRFLIALKEELASIDEQLSGYDVLLSKRKKLEDLIKDYETGYISNKPISNDITSEAKPIDWEQVKKSVIEIVNNNGHFIKANIISKELWGDETTEEMKNRLSSYLGMLESQKKLYKYKVNNNNRETYWGLPNWMRGDVPDKRYWKGDFQEQLTM